MVTRDFSGEDIYLVLIDKMTGKAVLRTEGREEPDSSGDERPGRGGHLLEYWRAKILRIFVRQYQMSRPPSTSSAVPVIISAPSEAR
jgi:hypothetical protein